MVQGLPYQEVQKQWILQWGRVSIKVWSFHFYKGIADECSGCHLDFFVLGTCTLRLGRSSNGNTTLCRGRVKEVLKICRLSTLNVRVNKCFLYQGLRTNFVCCDLISSNSP